MPRVTSATKNKGGKKEYRCRRCGKTIEPGQKYFKYSFRYGGTYYHCASHTPKPSELTQSKMSAVLEAIEAAEERLDAELAFDDDIDDFDPDQFIEAVRDIVTEVHTVAEEVRDEYQSALDEWEHGNYQLEERVGEMDTFVDALDGFDPSATYEAPDKSEYGDEDPEIAEDVVELRASEIAEEDGNPVDDDYRDLAREALKEEAAAEFDQEGYEDAVRDAIDNYLNELRSEVDDVFGEVPG